MKDELAGKCEDMARRGLFVRDDFGKADRHAIAELAAYFAQALAEEVWRAHVPVTGTQHDPSRGLIHGYCERCRNPWPCEYAPEKAHAEEIEKLKNELTPPMFAALATKLKEECERQHARAERAEAQAKAWQYDAAKWKEHAEQAELACQDWISKYHWLDEDHKQAEERGA